MEIRSELSKTILDLGFYIFSSSPVFVLQLLGNSESFVSDGTDTEDAEKNRRNEDREKKNKDNSFLSFDSDSQVFKHT